MYNFKMKYDRAVDIINELKAGDRAWVLIGASEMALPFFIFPLNRGELPFFVDEDFGVYKKKKEHAVSKVLTEREVRILCDNEGCENAGSVKELLYYLKKGKTDNDQPPTHHWYNIPAYPEWFTKNLWLLSNQEHKFTKALINAINMIQMDQGGRAKSEKPMENTRKYLAGDMTANACKEHYLTALEAFNQLGGADKRESKKVLGEFKTEFEEYHTAFTKEEEFA